MIKVCKHGATWGARCDLCARRKGGWRPAKIELIRPK
jgi:hypothetical protein